jgi:hypothetical protein
MARGKSVRLLVSIPEKYAPNFMERLDMRTVLGTAVLDRYQANVSDLGGTENLSTVKHSHARRFTWFEIMIEGMECRAAAGEGVDIGAWTPGLERRQKPIRRLHEVMNGTAKAVSA